MLEAIEVVVLDKIYKNGAVYGINLFWHKKQIFCFPSIELQKSLGIGKDFQYALYVENKVNIVVGRLFDLANIKRH